MRREGTDSLAVAAATSHTPACACHDRRKGDVRARSRGIVFLRMFRAFCTVALLAFALLLLRAGGISLAGDYIDPISHITAQDEALYAHSAIAMAREGEWLTPHFMGRYALYKPPMLIWAAAFSAR